MIITDVCDKTPTTKIFTKKLKYLFRVCVIDAFSTVTVKNVGGMRRNVIPTMAFFLFCLFPSFPPLSHSLSVHRLLRWNYVVVVVGRSALKGQLRTAATSCRDTLILHYLQNQVASPVTGIPVPRNPSAISAKNATFVLGL